MNYIILGKNYISPLFRKDYYKGDKFTILTEDELATSDIEFSTSDKVYAPDETSVPLIFSRIKNDERREKLETIKNKFNCRELLADLYPDFYFESVKLDEFTNWKRPDEQKNYYIKPQKGFFGAAVKKISPDSNLNDIVKEIKEDIKNKSKDFSADVFAQQDMLIEQELIGEEYTIDAFFDEKGRPVITNMCYHPLPRSNKYYHHLLYLTDKEVHKRLYNESMKMLDSLNAKVNLKNLPMHIEFIDQDGKLIPVEINLPRFGGFGNSDLPFHSFDVDPYKHFFKSKKPNWKKIWQENEGNNYGWVLCYNPKDIDKHEFRPDHDKMKRDLGDVLDYQEIDYRENPVFAVAYIKKGSRDELMRLLDIEFRDYFVEI